MTLIIVRSFSLTVLVTQLIMILIIDQFFLTSSALAYQWNKVSYFDLKYNNVNHLLTALPYYHWFSIFLPCALHPFNFFCKILKSTNDTVVVVFLWLNFWGLFFRLGFFWLLFFVISALNNLNSVTENFFDRPHPFPPGFPGLCCDNCFAQFVVQVWKLNSMYLHCEFSITYSYEMGIIVVFADAIHWLLDRIIIAVIFFLPTDYLNPNWILKVNIDGQLLPVRLYVTKCIFQWNMDL